MNLSIMNVSLVFLSLIAIVVWLFVANTIYTNSPANTADIQKSIQACPDLNSTLKENLSTGVVISKGELRELEMKCLGDSREKQINIEQLNSLKP